jgi:uncharacterized protein YggE
MLRLMAGMIESPHQRAMKKAQRDLEKRARLMHEEAMLVEMISRRQEGVEGTAPMPFNAMRADLEKMAKGEL